MDPKINGVNEVSYDWHSVYGVVKPDSVSEQLRCKARADRLIHYSPVEGAIIDLKSASSLDEIRTGLETGRWRWSEYALADMEMEGKL
jgi:hypothetical protein